MKIDDGSNVSNGFPSAQRLPSQIMWGRKETWGVSQFLDSRTCSFNPSVSCDFHKDMEVLPEAYLVQDGRNDGGVCSHDGAHTNSTLHRFSDTGSSTTYLPSRIDFGRAWA